MSIVNTLSRSGHFEEFNSPLVTNEGVLTILERKQRAMENLTGVTTGVGTVTTAATTDVLHIRDATGQITSEFNFTSFAVGTGGDNAALGIGAKFFDFPAGIIHFIDASINGSFTSATAYTNVLDAGIGSVIASGVVSALGGTATFEDFIGSLTSAALPTATITGVSGDTAAAGIRNRIIAAASAHTVHLNCAGTWTDVNPAGAVTFTGRAILRWRILT